MTATGGKACDNVAGMLSQTLETRSWPLLRGSLVLSTVTRDGLPREAALNVARDGERMLQEMGPRIVKISDDLSFRRRSDMRDQMI